MISGKMKKLNKILITLLFVVTLPLQANETNVTLPEILTMFSKIKKSTADFKEEKFTSFLEAPMISSGQLEFVAPAQLAKYIVEPEKISNKIQENELEIKTKDETHIINLKEHPEFSIILTSIINVLAGEHEALVKDFNIAVTGELAAWQLVLVPRDSFIRGHIDSIKMYGANDKLTKIIVTESNKDYSVTYISNHR